MICLAEKKYPTISRLNFILLSILLTLFNNALSQIAMLDSNINNFKMQLIISEGFTYSKSKLNTNVNAVGVSSGWANSLDVMLFSIELRKYLTKRNAIGVEFAAGAYSINAKRDWKVFDSTAGITYGGSSYTTSFPTKDISLILTQKLLNTKRYRLDCYLGPSLVIPIKSNSYPYESVINGSNVYSYIHVGDHMNKFTALSIRGGLFIQYAFKKLSIHTAIDFQKGLTVLSQYSLKSQFNQYSSYGFIESRSDALRFKLGLGYLFSNPLKSARK
jgi:hypothetical protein